VLWNTVDPSRLFEEFERPGLRPEQSIGLQGRRSSNRPNERRWPDANSDQCRQGAGSHEIDPYRPVRWSGDRIRLHATRAEDLCGYRRLVTTRDEVMVQGWGSRAVAGARAGRTSESQRVAAGVGGVVMMFVCPFTPRTAICL
jgi:hypothetical protein